MSFRFVQRGFTVIELMIAAAVLAILVVVAIPQLVDYTHRGEDAAAQADGRAFLTAAVGASGLGGEADKPKSDEKADPKADPKAGAKVEGGK